MSQIPMYIELTQINSNVNKLEMQVVMIDEGLNYKLKIKTSRAPEFTPGFFVGHVLLILLVFCVLSYYVCLRSEFRVVMSITISA